MVLQQWYLAITSQRMARKACFYVDDRSIQDHDPIYLQATLANMESLFL